MLYYECRLILHMTKVSRFAIPTSPSSPPVPKLPPMTFAQLIRNQRKIDPTWKAPEVLLSLDPGGTTGWSLFKNGKLVDGGQVKGSNLEMEKLIVQMKPSVIVCEAFLLYPWKAKSLAWSSLQTSQLIGAIKLIGRQQRVRIVEQGANLAKNFCSDDLLKMWRMYSPTKRHMNDSIRHGAYYLLFHRDKK